MGARFIAVSNIAQLFRVSWPHLVLNVPNVSAFSQGGSGDLLAFTALGQRFAPAKGQAFEFDYEHQ